MVNKPAGVPRLESVSNFDSVCSEACYSTELDQWNQQVRLDTVDIEQVRYGMAPTNSCVCRHIQTQPFLSLLPLSVCEEKAKPLSLQLYQGVMSYLDITFTSDAVISACVGQ